MSNLFNNKQNGFNDKSSITSLEKNTEIQSNSQINEYNNIIDYPYASKE
jgi:hypothetical protein